MALPNNALHRMRALLHTQPIHTMNKRTIVQDLLHRMSAKELQCSAANTSSASRHYAAPLHHSTDPSAANSSRFQTVQQTAPRSPARRNASPHKSCEKRQSSRVGSEGWIEKRLEEMGIRTAPNHELLTLRSAYSADPCTNMRRWMEQCAAMEASLKSHYSAHLCFSTAEATRTHPPLTPRTDSAARSPSTARLQHEAVVAARSKLARVIAQGPSMLFTAWSGATEKALSACNGEYIIPPGSAIRQACHAAKTTRAKSAFLRQLAGDTQSPKSRIIVRGGISSPADDESVEGSARDEGEPAKVVVAVRHDNFLQLSVYLGSNQMRELVNARPADARPVTTSPFLFSCSAVCVGRDKWLILDGGWKDQVLHFLRRPADAADGTPDSLLVDDLCFERKYRPPAVDTTDAFQCTKCGHVRACGNTVYVQGRDLARGKYPCAVCRRKTLHLRQTVDGRPAQQPCWKGGVCLQRGWQPISAEAIPLM